MAELLGQVKSPTATDTEIERSGLEVFKAGVLGDYERDGLVASNCVDRVCHYTLTMNFVQSDKSLSVLSASTIITTMMIYDCSLANTPSTKLVSITG